MIYMILLVTSIAIGEEERSIKYQRETTVDFDAIDITGEIIKPTGALIVERSNVRFNPLIELRTDWNQEMVQSVTLVK